MSGSISGLTGGSYGLMQQLIADASATSAKLNQLTTQSTTGYVAATYAGLDSATPGSAAGALSLAPQIAGINNTVTNLNAVAGQMQVQQSTITAISQIASSVLSQFQTVSAETPQGALTSASMARQALSQIGNLLNTQDGTSYIFSGQNSAVPPISNPNNITSSTFYTNIQSAVQNLASNPNAAAAVISSGATTPPFTSPPGISPQPTQVAGAGGALITTGLVANANTLIPASSGTTTTGSYMNDIMTSLAAIGSVTTAQTSSPNFAGFAASMINTLSGAINTMASDAGALGNNQALIATQSTNLQQTATALTTQLAGYDQVNMTSTLANLSSTQTQLQASYQLIAAMKTMSLTQYI
ncbi:flagellin [Acidiphilium sp.]|uniref:flagellin n=1 Tax=Acidiphilium sp. TaxID=527 RepID=UPI003D045553